MKATLVVLLFLMFCSGCNRHNVSTEIDISYGEANGQKLLLDVIRPASKSEKLRPAMILVHGGAWGAGDKREFHDMGRGLAIQGYVTFSINYRLVTEQGNKWPAQLDDTQRAIRWIRAHAEQFGIDPQRIGAIGGSAGGHIVACLATSDTRDNSIPSLASYSSRVSCVIDLAGPTDLTEDLSLKIKNGAWTNEQIRILLGGTPDQFQELAKNASPLFHVDDKTAPVLIFHGRLDDLVPVDHATRFAEALSKAGVDTKLVVFDKDGHGFEDPNSLVTFIEEAGAFLKKYLPVPENR